MYTFSKHQFVCMYSYKQAFLIGENVCIQQHPEMVHYGEQLDYCLQGLSSKKKSEPKTYAGQPGNEHLSFGVDGGY